MNKRKLREQLEKLHTEIENSEGMDERGRLLIRQAEADLRQTLEQADQKTSPPATSQLEETIAYLEATHPNVTTILTEFLNILSNAGI